MTCRVAGGGRCLRASYVIRSGPGLLFLGENFKRRCSSRCVTGCIWNSPSIIGTSRSVFLTWRTQFTAESFVGCGQASQAVTATTSCPVCCEWSH